VQRLQEVIGALPRALEFASADNSALLISPMASMAAREAMSAIRASMRRFDFSMLVGVMDASVGRQRASG